MQINPEVVCGFVVLTMHHSQKIENRKSGEPGLFTVGFVSKEVQQERLITLTDPLKRAIQLRE
jgi:hypothetical protein